jgi:cyanophycinase
MNLKGIYMHTHVPKGTLILIGGAEDRGKKDDVVIADRSAYFKPMEILRELLPDTRGSRGIEIITTATRHPDKIVKSYRYAFNKIGFKRVSFINLSNNAEGSKKEFIRRIKKAHTVFFTGGDQYRLSVILGNTDVLNELKERYYTDSDFTVAGTSAGAMAIPTLMMFEGENHEAILKGTVKISSGLGFMDGCIVDTHFAKRGRFGRLAQAVVMNPTCVGIGIGEDTALVIKKGREGKCIGSGMVLIIDGKHMAHTNMAYADNFEPVCIEGLTVHILCRDTGFLLEERKFVPSKKMLKEEKHKHE